MAVCDVQTLISANPCLYALNDHMLEVLEVQQLCSLYNNLNDGEPITCDIQTLIDDAACFYNLSSHELKVLKAQLLCNILSLL